MSKGRAIDLDALLKRLAAARDGERSVTARDVREVRLLVRAIRAAAAAPSIEEEVRSLRVAVAHVEEQVLAGLASLANICAYNCQRQPEDKPEKSPTIRID